MAGPRCLWDASAQLGEGPVWCAAEQALYWVDILAPAVLRLWPASGQREVFPMPEPIGCIGLVQGGGLVAGLRSGFAFLDLEAERVTPIDDPEGDRPGNRFNDGKVSPDGRFWAGTMDDGQREPSGCLYRLDRDLSVTRADEGYVITNGPAFSPDGRTLYHVDTLAGRVDAFEHDPDTGDLSNRRVFAQLDVEQGYPDGLTVDAEGGVWCALWGGWGVRRFTPAGEELGGLELPVANVTSCTFGGEDLATLFITSASVGLDADQREQQPLAGGLFAAEVGPCGLPTPSFAPLQRPHKKQRR